jgi:hypothetical protein
MPAKLELAMHFTLGIIVLLAWLVMSANLKLAMHFV